MQNDPIAESAMATLLARHPALAACADKITDAYRILRDSIAQGGTVFVCGNGGSHADADHIIGELSKGFLLKRKLPAELVKSMSEKLGEDAAPLCDRLQMGMRAMLLDAHPALSSAYANDVDPVMCYQHLRKRGKHPQRLQSRRRTRHQTHPLHRKPSRQMRTVCRLRHRRSRIRNLQDSGTPPPDLSCNLHHA